MPLEGHRWVHTGWTTIAATADDVRYIVFGMEGTNTDVMSPIRDVHLKGFRFSAAGNDISLEEIVATFRDGTQKNIWHDGRYTSVRDISSFELDTTLKDIRNVRVTLHNNHASTTLGAIIAFLWEPLR